MQSRCSELKFKCKLDGCRSLPVEDVEELGAEANPVHILPNRPAALAARIDWKPFVYAEKSLVHAFADPVVAATCLAAGK